MGDAGGEGAFGVRQLISALLSPATLSHIVLLVISSVALLGVTRSASDGAGLVAVIFTALVGAQILTAIVARSESGCALVSVPVGLPFGKRIRASFKSILLPIIATGLIAGALLGTIASEPDVRDDWALVLASLFIAWSAGQALSFRSAVSRWVAGGSRCADSSPSGSELPGFAALMLFEQAILAGTIAALFGHFLPMWLDRPPDPGIWAIYIPAAIAIPLISITLAKRRVGSAIKTVGGRALAHRWGFLCFGFAAWHLASTWRRLFTNPDDVLMLIEEALLMVLTVFAAVWALSSRTVRSGGTLLTQRNALFWALAFGYAYAGSIIVLTDLSGAMPFFGTLPATLGIGHAVTVATLILAYSGPVVRGAIVSVEKKNDDSDSEDEGGAEASSSEAQTAAASVAEEASEAAEEASEAAEADAEEAVESIDLVDTPESEDYVELMDDDDAVELID